MFIEIIIIISVFLGGVLIGKDIGFRDANKVFRKWKKEVEEKNCYFQKFEWSLNQIRGMLKNSNVTVKYHVHKDKKSNQSK